MGRLASPVSHHHSPRSLALLLLPIFSTPFQLIRRCGQVSRQPSVTQSCQFTVLVFECCSPFSCSVMSDSVTPWTAARQATLSFTISQSLLKLMSIESVIPSNHLILCCSLLQLPSIFPSIRVFSRVSALCIRWPKYWSFSFSTVLPMNSQG